MFNQKVSSLIDSNILAKQGKGSVEMKLFVLAALIAAAASSGQLNDNQQQQPWPWQAGKQYQYEVESHTVARLPEGSSTGSAFKARFIIRAKPNGHLQAKLENPQHATIHHELLADRVLPTDLKYESVQNLENPFEITLNGGRVQTLNLPAPISLAQENLLKGLISALQVDLSTHRHISSPQDSYDKETQQGLFRKMETDVTGDCETLYTVSPVASEWRRELPNFNTVEEPIEITKTKNYGHCHHRVAYHFGVPEGAEWTGTASRPDEEQLIKHNTFSRMLVGRQGPIYKAEATSTVHVQPLLQGQQEAEVHSHVMLHLVKYEQDSQDQWAKLEGGRVINNLLYSISNKRSNIRHYSSEESNEEIEVDVNTNRVRRSISPKMLSINKLIVRNQLNGQGSSSSESNSVYVNDEVPNNNEPAYAALYLNSQNRGDKKQNSMNAQRLVQEIAQQLQNPNNMQKSDLLSKFNILVRIISAMSYEQLSQTSNAIEVGKSSNNIVKSDMWMVYRDAVAQAGTLPAFKQIKTWIENKKLEGEEAAEVVATLANTLRYPTKETMTEFFQLAMNPEVKQQKYLHSAALIAATKFINMGQVNNETAQSYYPTHMYGRLARQHDNFVVDEVLPQLRQHLKESIEQDHSHLAQVYIKAIGNLGHRAILDVFAPYLEGKIPVSIYLRYQMVDNLQVLAYQKDKYARAVLYSILRNTAEADDVRVAAILNIFMSRPTGAMMQAMAQMTKEDPSVQVRAALKSGIESAAQLKNPRYLDLARTAQAARSILTKERFGYQYSLKNYNDYFDGDNQFGIFAVLSKIGSEDSLFPQHLQYAWKNRVGGWSHENLISVSTSSPQKLTQYLQQLLMTQQQQQQRQQQQQQGEPNHKYSAHKIAQMLNIQRDPKHPLEFAVAINLMNQQRYFTFDQKDMPELNSAIQGYIGKLKQGVEKHYTKIFNQAQVSIMFPVAMGVPFIYKYKEPTVLHIHAKAKGDVSFEQQHQQYSGSMDKEIQFTFARNIDGSVGFLDTLSEQYASVGVINKFQVYTPIKIHAELKNGEVKINLQPIQPQQEINIVHFSVWPYSANQKKDSLTTIALDPSTKLIARTNKVVSVDSKFGQSTGMPFQVQGYSYSQDYRNLVQMYEYRDLLSNIAYALHQKDVALTHFNFRYLGKQAQNNGGVTFSAAYDTYYNQQEQAGKLVASTPSVVTPNSQQRRQEMAKRVSSGINTAKAQVVDLSAVFEGAQKKEFVVTAAIGRSPVDDKVQYALFSSPLQGEGYINAVGSVVLPHTTALNFLETLQKDLKVTFSTDIKFGQGNGNIHIQGQAERTKKYQQALVNMPLGKKCAQEIAKNNYYQSACHRMIVLAHTPDNFKASVTYKEVSPIAKYMSFQAWRIAQYLGFWNSDANPLKTTADGKLNVEVQAFYLEKYMNFAVNTRVGEFHVKNVHIPKFAAGVLSTYAPVSGPERVFNYFTQHQYLPFCSVDGSRVRSFSDRQYDYTLSQAWHVVIQDEPQKHHDNKYHDQLVVLARRPTENQQEAYVSYRSETGMDLEIELKPAQGVKKASVHVKTKANKESDSPLTIYWDDATDSSLLDYYYMPDGVLMLNIREDRLRVIYDGQRIVIWSDGNRNNTRGICGQMSGNMRDDFQAPHGLVDQPQYYAASFALNDEFSDPKTQELQTKAKQMSYHRQIHHTSILRSDNEFSEVLKNLQSSLEDWGSQSVYRTRSYKKGQATCQMQQQVQYYENHGEICITTTALPACQSHCHSQEYKVQAAQVVCRPKWDQEYLNYREQIRQEQNPKITGPSNIKQYRIPTTCAA